MASKMPAQPLGRNQSGKSAKQHAPAKSSEPLWLKPEQEQRSHHQQQQCWKAFPPSAPVAAMESRCAITA